ncbi:hypothetical protein KGF56_002755 [Candida oxycetoniae]|uniref:Uncharacterized protein n=1 Tax=Candida oxycetoniae TaxID=497107 RepID=A0AAI9SWL6_9ASCO|nr:uncharacterized protein KGF56_002755 [Candida oxycetoniae]KAI3404458.2 hypothetical protein KGF56_002755 [Candida oxycetoniae]
MVTKANGGAPLDTAELYSFEDLTIGTNDQIQALAKQTPTILPNQQADKDYAKTLDALRSTYPYIFVVNWLYNYRGFLKLQSEAFDVDIFEMELLNYFPQEENHHGNEAMKQGHVLFINRLKVALISNIQNSKMSSVNNFEAIFRLWFGVNTPLGGIEIDDDDNEEEEEEEEKEEKEKKEIEVVTNDSELPRFDYLLIKDKFEILYILISYIAKSPKFRDWLSKQSSGPELSRIDPVFTQQVRESTREEYYLLCDDTRLYKRTITFNPLVIPKKRKLSPEHPQDYYKPSSFDISDKVTFEIQYKNIYEFNNYIHQLKRQRNLKTLYSKLTRTSTIESMFDSELKKRRYLSNKKKEAQLASLLAVRKRSSRLEAKQRQRTEEEARQRAIEQEELKLAAQARLERRQKLKQRDVDILGGSSTGMTRDERLKRRNEILYNRHLNVTPTPTPTPTPPTPVSNSVQESPIADESNNYESGGSEHSFNYEINNGNGNGNGNDNGNGESLHENAMEVVHNNTVSAEQDSNEIQKIAELKSKHGSVDEIDEN